MFCIMKSQQVSPDSEKASIVAEYHSSVNSVVTFDETLQCFVETAFAFIQKLFSIRHGILL